MLDRYQPETETTDAPARIPWAQILVFFAILLVLVLALVGANPAQAPAVTAAPRVSFSVPADGATVPATFAVTMSAQALTVEPAGEIHDGAGHFHILVDTDFVEAGSTIPRDEQHLHFGDGATSTELTLTPGTHVLRLQFADGAHTALEGDQYRDEITVTVEE
jgi:hypothetical protein